MGCPYHTVIRVFLCAHVTPATKGGFIVNVNRFKEFALALVFMLMTAASASAELIYLGQTGSNFVGAVTRESSGLSAHPFLATGFGTGSTSYLYSFKDTYGKDMVVVTEAVGAQGNDTIYVYDASDWSRPVVNTKAINCYTINGASAMGRYLYIACTQRYKVNGQNTPGTNGTDGSVIKLDTADGYKEVGRYDFPGPAKKYLNDESKLAAGNVMRRGYDVLVRGDHVYVTVRSNGTYGSDGSQYDASEIYNFDRDLNVLGRAFLEEDNGSYTNGSTWTGTWWNGRGVYNMAYYNGKLYIVTMGGTASSATSNGAIWSVDTARLTRTDDNHDGVELLFTANDLKGQSFPEQNIAFRVLQVIAISDSGAVLVMGAGTGSGSPTPYLAPLFRSTVAELDAKTNPPALIAFPANGAGRPGLVYDEYGKNFWYTANRQITMYEANGDPIPQTLGEDQHKGENGTGMLSIVAVERVNTDTSGGGGAPSGCASGVTALLVLLALPLTRKKAR